MFDVMYYLLLLQVSICFLVFFISMLSYVSTKLKLELIFSLLFLFLSVGSIFIVYSSILAPTYELRILAVKIGWTLQVLGFFIISFFLLEFTPMKFKQQIYLLIISALESVLLVSINYYNEVAVIYLEDYNRYFPVFTSITSPIAFMLLALTDGIFFIDVFKSSFIRGIKYLKNINKKALVQIYELFAAGIIILFSCVLSVPLSFLIPHVFAIQLLYVFILIGTFLILISYFLSPIVPYLISVQPIELYVLTEAGIPIFNFRFMERTRYDETLVGGALLALVQFGRETFGAQKTNYIDWGEIKVIFEYRGGLIFALLSMVYHKLISDTLKEFAEKFIKMFGADYEKYKNRIYEFRRANKIVQEMFPFLKSNEEDYQ
ncbi:MAG: hypothetical protein ABGF52_12820 [Candidatus Asgardarchaeum sp.]